MMDRGRCLLSGRNYLLPLVILASCRCAAEFLVDVKQSSYQAEENHNITLRWTFTNKPASSCRNLSIHCYQSVNKTVLISYQVHDGVEVSEYQDKQFAGRVQLKKDALAEGQIRLHVSKLKTEDSGSYLCDVRTDYGFGSRRCQLTRRCQLDVFSTLPVNATHSSYQAEENNNVTLEWTFTNKTDCSSNNFYITCRLLADLKPSILYQFFEGAELSESQDQQFAGRVQSEKDVLREGLIRLHVSRLSVNDSGRYWCEVQMGKCFGQDSSYLNVTAASHHTFSHGPTTPPPSEGWGSTGIRVGLSAAAAAVVVLLIILGIHCYSLNRQKQQIQPERIPLRTRTL